MPPELDEVFDNFADSDLATKHGFLFAAMDVEGQKIYSRAMGPYQSENRFSEDSFLWLASASKLATTVAALIAVEKGLVSLDEPVGKYVPQLDNPDVIYGFEHGSEPEKPIIRKAKKKLNLRHLLSHTSGFAYRSLHPKLSKWEAYCYRSTGNLPIRSMRSRNFSGSIDVYDCPLVFEPGENWCYGPGVDWAGKVIEAVSGKSLDAFCQEYIWDPIGVHDTTFRPAARPDLLSRRPKMTRIGSPDTSSSLDLYPLETKDHLGGLGLWTTPKDFNTFLSVLLSGGGKIMSVESVLQLAIPQFQDSKRYMKKIHTYRGGIQGNGFSKSTPLAGGLSTCITLSDAPGEMAKGSISWMGYPNIYWWIDFETGICAALYMQAVPLGPRTVLDLWEKLVPALYKNITLYNAVGLDRHRALKL